MLYFLMDNQNYNQSEKCMALFIIYSDSISKQCIDSVCMHMFNDDLDN